MQKMNKNGFSQCAGAYIERLRKEGRYSTAHVYKNALFSFSKFCGTLNISFIFFIFVNQFLKLKK